MLTQLGVITPGSTRISGVSAGAIALAPQLGLISTEQLTAAAHELAARCRARNNCMWSLEAELTLMLRKLIPAGTYAQLNERQIAYVPVSFVTPGGGIETRVFSRFRSDDDVVRLISTTTYIPLWNAPNVTTTYRGERAYDGSFTVSLPCPPGVTRCVRVSMAGPEFAKRLAGSLLAGGSKALLGAAATTLAGQHPANVTRTLLGALPKPDQAVLAHQVAHLAAALTQMVNGPPIDIFPGKYAAGKLPWSASEFLAMMLEPCTPDVCEQLIALGRADAAGWAAEHGITVASAAKKKASAKKTAGVAATPKAG
jgi:hypothetical protein